MLLEFVIESPKRTGFAGYQDCEPILNADLHASLFDQDMIFVFNH